MIIDEIKKRNIEALRSKDENARAILGMVASRAKLAEIAKRDKNEPLVDADVIQVLQKTSKELAEEAENYAKVNNKEMQAQILLQQKIVESFLPQMMSENDIMQIIEKLADKSLPSIMKHFKAEYAGKCDMKMVQEAAKKVNS